MKFIPVDWTIYNKSPYFPEWLSRGETRKLTEYDDGFLAELDALADEMSEQYDLDKAKNVILDRIGKILNEKRATDDDNLYRLLNRVKILLNTTNGSVNDIIKIIRLIFASEEIHIEPRYPAGITILHDGESPLIDFNRYISQAVGAGISYDTRELFFFKESFPLTDADRKCVQRTDKEMFSDTIFRNGRILRDGHTIYDTEFIRLFHDGSVRRNGYAKRNAMYRVSAFGHIALPILHRSGIQDFFDLYIGS